MFQARGNFRTIELLHSVVHKAALNCLVLNKKNVDLLENSEVAFFMHLESFIYDLKMLARVFWSPQNNVKPSITVRLTSWMLVTTRGVFLNADHWQLSQRRFKWTLAEVQ